MFTISAERRLRRVAAILRQSAAPLLFAFLAGFLPAACEEDESETERPEVNFVYVSSAQSNRIRGFYMDKATGALTEMESSPFNGLTSIGRMYAHPSGQAVFVAQSSGSSIAIKELDLETGALYPSPGAFNSGGPIVSPVISPDGSIVYTNNNVSNVVRAYDYDPAGMTMSEHAGSPYAVTTPQRLLAFDASGQYLYGPNFAGAFVSYAVNASTGAVSNTPLGSYAAGGTPEEIVADPNGKFMFGTDYSGPFVYSFQIDTADGDLLFADQILVAPGSRAMSVHPSGEWLYVVPEFEEEVRMLRVATSNGGLSEPNPPLAIGGTTQYARPTPDGQYLLVIETTQSTLSARRISAAGEVSAQPVAIADVDAQPVHILVVDPQAAQP